MTKQKNRLKIGTKVKTSDGDQYVHKIQTGAPYPYYTHPDRDCPEGTPLNGPFTRDELLRIEDEEPS